MAKKLESVVKGMGSRDSLLRKRNRRTKTVTIDANFPDADLAGQSFIVRTMSAGERGKWEAQFTHSKTGKPLLERQAEIRERLCIACLIDDQGNQLLQPDDLEALKDVDSAILEAIVKAAQELNNIADEDLEDLAKN